MNGRFSTLLLVFMTISLAGIICIQGYWICDSLKSNEDHFSFNANEALMSVSKKIEEQEFNRYFYPLKQIIDSLKSNNKTYKGNFIKSIDNASYTNAHKQCISSIIDSKINDIINSSQFSLKEIEKNKLDQLTTIAHYEYYLYETLIKEHTNEISINKRITSKAIEDLIEEELQKRNLNVDFEFRVFKNKKPTNVSSLFFSKSETNTYQIPIFKSNKNLSLWVNFTGKKIFVWSSVISMIALSSLLILVILATYFYAYKLIIGQKKISEIKTDFINNMTHELKTPIATINLALDFMKNDKVITDTEMLRKYLGIIRFENERIHNQVERVLATSRLEKSELSINKEPVDFHKILNKIIVTFKKSNLLVETSLKASKTIILANEESLSNVIINILDNSVKYSVGIPEINIITKNQKNNIVFKVIDQGIGIGKHNKQKVFDNFFRGHTGNIHNVKGCGLGLSYSKKIIEDHQGQISIKSSKAKGTTLTVELPLIT